MDFTSRDAHIGALCRRSDLEILAFNILSWLSGGRLPWMSNLKDHKYVYECKKYYMDRLDELFNYAFRKSDGNVNLTPPVMAKDTRKTPFDRTRISKDVPDGLYELFQYIVKLEFKEKPDYELIKAILVKAINKTSEHDGKFSFSPVKAKVSKAVGKGASRLKRTSLSSPQLGNGARKGKF